MAALTMPSPPMAAIIPFISWLELIPKVACTYSTTWRKQSSSDEWIEAFCDLVLEWKPVGWAEEKGQISAGVGPALDKRQRERKAYCYRQQFPTRGRR